MVDMASPGATGPSGTSPSGKGRERCNGADQTGEVHEWRLRQRCQTWLEQGVKGACGRTQCRRGGFDRCAVQTHIHHDVGQPKVTGGERHLQRHQ